MSGWWWAGELNGRGMPHATQRPGSPRGYYRPDFGGTEDDRLRAAFSTPRFRVWAESPLAHIDLYGARSVVVPPVIRSDLSGMNMVTPDDPAGGTRVAVKFCNGNRSSRVSASINGGAAIAAQRTRPGEGAGALAGPECASRRRAGRPVH